MSLFSSRRLFLLQVCFLTISACKAKSDLSGSLVIGAINYNEGKVIIKDYERFDRYLSEVLRTRVEVEPTFNELRALERLQSQAWFMIFAPPGIAVLAIDNHQYVPIFPQQESMNNLRSIFVVREDSPIRELGQLEKKSVGLGQVGSATGYYFPIYNLYGLTLAKVLFAPSPKTILEWVAEGTVTAGAVSTEEFNLHRSQFSSTEFRVLYTDSHPVPPGLVLLSPNINRTDQERIIRAMESAPPDLVQEAGYVPNASVPNYDYMTSVVKRVEAIAVHSSNKPVRLKID